MFKCKIGIVSFPVGYEHDCFLNLGEIYDKNLRQDVNKLYEFHKNLQYFCGFLANTTESNKVVPNNIEEIKILQRIYKLTPKIFLNKKIKEEEIEFTTPQMYDISCMVPLFPDPIPRCIYTKNKTNRSKLFIIPPYVDPVMRGRIIMKCIESIGDTLGYFLTIGKSKGNNKQNSCELNRDYLMSCNVPEECIAMNENDEFPDYIPESVNIGNMIFQPDEICIGVDKEDIGEFLNCIRFLRKDGKIEEKVFFICD